MDKHAHILLVVDDEPSLRSALVIKLSHEGFSVLEAKNGEEGLAVALKDHPDLILLDIVMPVMDGMTMLKKLREDSWGKTAKVIILTNLADDQKLADAIDQGSYEYLIKTDWKMGEVVDKVKAIFRDKNKGQALG